MKGTIVPIKPEVVVKVIESIAYWWACKNYVLRWEYGY